jgi:hypothetical protein
VPAAAADFFAAPALFAGGFYFDGAGFLGITFFFLFIFLAGVDGKNTTSGGT